MKFLDLFSGIGGFRLGLEMAGHECVGHCEIDKFANKSYIAMHEPKESEWFEEDITKVRTDELPATDIWCFGFPCQDTSIAGKQKGFGGHRSSLFFSVTRLIRELEEEDKPSILFIENVKNLLSVNRGYDFLKLLIELDEIGYDAEWDILNSKHFGVPQNRERLFIVGHFRGRSTRKVFPIRQRDKIHHKSNEAQKELYETAPGSFINVVGNLDRPQYHESSNRVYGVDGIAPAQNTQQGGGHETKIAVIDDIYTNREPRVYADNAPTLRAERQGLKVSNGMQVRRLTPKECFRLQGFPDECFEKAREVNSDTQLYKQAGNTVTVNVIYEIARRFYDEKVFIKYSGGS